MTLLSLPLSLSLCYCSGREELWIVSSLRDPQTKKKDRGDPFFPSREEENFFVAFLFVVVRETKKRFTNMYLLS